MQIMANMLKKDMCSEAQELMVGVKSSVSESYNKVMERRYRRAKQKEYSDKQRSTQNRIKD